MMTGLEIPRVRLAQAELLRQHLRRLSTEDLLVYRGLMEQLIETLQRYGPSDSYPTHTEIGRHLRDTRAPCRR